MPEAIRRVARQVWGDAPLVEGFGFGADDGRYLPHCPRRACLRHFTTTQPAPMTAVSGFDAHGPDERVSARWFAEGVQWFNALVVELAR